MNVARGTVVMLDPDPVVLGHEQAGARPAVVVSDDQVSTRFGTVCVVPLTRTPVRGPIYPEVRAVAGSGLTSNSTALACNVRGIDPMRIRRIGGKIRPEDLDTISAALRTLLTL